MKVKRYEIVDIDDSPIDGVTTALHIRTQRTYDFEAFSAASNT